MYQCVWILVPLYLSRSREGVGEDVVLRIVWFSDIQGTSSYVLVTAAPRLRSLDPPDPSHANPSFSYY